MGHVNVRASLRNPANNDLPTFFMPPVPWLYFESAIYFSLTFHICQTSHLAGKIKIDRVSQRNCKVCGVMVLEWLSKYLLEIV